MRALAQGRWLVLLGLLLQLAPAPGQARAEVWTSAERTVLASLQLSRLPAAAADPSNAVERLPAAAKLGKRLFFDTRLSSNGQVACATCHLPNSQFQDGKPLAQGVGTGIRRTMPIADSHRHAWLFWDGRKDSLWSQALGPLEDPAEHGGNRVAFARLIGQHYRSDYEAVFGSLPGLDGLPAQAGPNGSAAERAAWSQLSSAQQTAVSRIFANMGKAIAAFEVSLRHGPSRLDRYIDATLATGSASGVLSASEQRGLRLFIGKAQCITCHGGPLLTDQHFHNTGVAPLDPKRPQAGRSAAVAQVKSDPFNCLGQFSDAGPRACRELRFIADDDPHMVGAFKTPSLRNVALRPPYMHAGQIATLTDVVRHYAAAPRAAVGHNERKPLPLSEQEIADLAGFLETLSGPIVEGESP